MTDHRPPLLIIGSDLDSIDLPNFFQSNHQIQTEFSLTENKYQNLKRIEIVYGGMTFEVEQFNKNQTQQILGKYCTNTLFSAPAEKGVESIGLWPSNHLASGKHLRSINSALLNIAKMLGQNLSVSQIGWLPANHCLEFGHFVEAVDDYLSGGPTPILLQIAIAKKKDKTLETQGLSYFANQEIRLSYPLEMSESDAIKRLVRVCHDIAVNGNINKEFSTDGLVQGEKLNFKPSSDLTLLAVNITI